MKLCLLCNTGFKSTGKQKYCRPCIDSGHARKDINKRYGHSDKNRASQRKYYYKNIEHTKKIKNAYNRSEKGRASKLRYYLKNRERIIHEITVFKRKENQARTNAHDKVKRQKIPKECVVCKVTINLNVHHIDKNPFNNDLDNLVYLCRSCHGKEHEALNLGRSNLPFIGQSPISVKKIIDNLRFITPN